MLFNRADTPQTLKVTWVELGLEPTAAMQVRDVVERKDLPKVTGELSSTVAPHAALFVVLSP